MRGSVRRSALIGCCLALLCAVPRAQDEPAQALDQMQKGRWDQAEETLASASGQSVSHAGALALRLRIELLERQGRYEEARNVAAGLLRLYQSGLLESASDLGQAAYAAWRLQRWEDANDIFIRASQMDEVPFSMYVDWGELYLEKYNPAEAEGIFKDGLEAASKEYDGIQRWSKADLDLGLAKALDAESSPGMKEVLTKALNLAPENPRIAAYRGRLALGEEDWDKAAEIADQGLKTTPGFLELLEIRSAAAFFSGQDEEFKRARAELEKVNPKDADLYELLGDLCVANRRLEDSVEQYSHALELNPQQWSALASRGINRLRLGDEDAGKADLEEAYAKDPYNIWTVNTLRLVDSFSRFDRIQDGQFSIKLSRKESAVLKPYVEELLHRSLETLEQRYQHPVDHPIVFEMYPDHEDFAVRTLGLPGLGALGATFGRIVAMDSPSARPPGTFHWGSTLWHEMAHVVTLSLSNDRVPRWFTEGLSMMEERSAGPGWGDPLTVQFVRTYEKGKLLPLKDLNSGFIHPETPEQISISYFQAGWLCRWMADQYGMPKIREMLIAFAKGEEDETAFKEVLGKTEDEVDALFHQELSKTLDPLLPKLQEVELESNDQAGLNKALETHPDNFYLNLALGSFLITKEDYQGAIEPLQRAIDSFPWAVDSKGPYALLSKAYEKLGDEEATGKVLAAWWNHSPLNIETGLKLARILAKQERTDEARQVLEQALYVDPLSAPLHEQLGDLCLQSKRLDEAVREFRALVALKPADEASAHFRLAKALFLAGSPQQARMQVLLSLELAPSYEEAQRLLLEISRQ